MKRAGARRGALLAAALLCGPFAAGGCGGPPATYYVVQWLEEPPVEASLRLGSCDVAVVVGEVLAAPALDRRQLLVRRPPDEVTYHHRWALPPAEIVRRFAAEGLRAEGLFREVVTDPSLLTSPESSCTVRGELDRFELVVGDELRWTVLVELRLVGRAADGSAVISRCYEGSREIAAQNRSMTGVVAGLREILGGIVAQLQRDLLEPETVAAVAQAVPPPEP
jgi:hypothetical protein